MVNYIRALALSYCYFLYANVTKLFDKIIDLTVELPQHIIIALYVRDTADVYSVGPVFLYPVNFSLFPI